MDIPGRGFETSLAINDSHCPDIEDTSRFVWLTTAEMSEDFPRVPTMMGVDVVLTDEVSFEIFGVAPVTALMSETKFEAAA